MYWNEFVFYDVKSSYAKFQPSRRLKSRVMTWFRPGTLEEEEVTSKIDGPSQCQLSIEISYGLDLHV